jgi:hypothetical protein
VASKSFYFFVFFVCAIKISINIEAIETKLSQNLDTHGKLLKQAFGLHEFNLFRRFIQIKRRKK